MAFDPTTFKPRNSLVLVRLFVKPEEKVGVITVPTENNEYAEAEVLAIGPSFPQAAGDVPSTTDLKVGQRVFVKHRLRRPGPAGGVTFSDQGVKLRHEDKEEGELWLFEQESLLAIVREAHSGDGHVVWVDDEELDKSIRDADKDPLIT